MWSNLGSDYSNVLNNLNWDITDLMLIKTIINSVTNEIIDITMLLEITSILLLVYLR